MSNNLDQMEVIKSTADKGKQGSKENPISI